MFCFSLECIPVQCSAANWVAELQKALWPPHNQITGHRSTYNYHDEHLLVDVLLMFLVVVLMNRVTCNGLGGVHFAASFLQFNTLLQSYVGSGEGRINWFVKE